MDAARVELEQAQRGGDLAKAGELAYGSIPDLEKQLGEAQVAAKGAMLREEVTDQDIAVVGGGDSAVEEATFLTKCARAVTLVHRRDELRASKIMADRAMANDKIHFAWNSAVDAIHGDGKLAGITLRDTLTGHTRELPVTGLFVAIGHDPRNDLVKGVIELDADGYVVAEGRSTRTNVPGVFACGDLVDHTYRQAITAAGSGCAAALDAERFLSDH